MCFEGYLEAVEAPDCRCDRVVRRPPMKRFLKFLAYLPVIFLGLIGGIVVLDMWRIDLTGRKPASAANGKTETPRAKVTPSVARQ